MFALGYKLHLSINAKSMLPLANVFASANQNEKKHSLKLVEKTTQILSKAKAKIRNVIADSQYSDRKLREAVAKTVIPYPSNQKRGVKGILRVVRISELMDRMSSRKNIISGLQLRQFTAS